MELPKYENKMAVTPALVYRGGEMPGVPTHDLNAREVILYGGRMYLLSLGVYSLPETKESEKCQE